MEEAKSNSGEEGENLQVVARVRPLSALENANNCKYIVECDKLTKSIIVYKPNSCELPKSYSFDHIFDEFCSQADVYCKTTRSIVDKVLLGFSGTILAYGRSGSGKSYTLFGDPHAEQTKGIICHAIAHIFGHIAKQTAASRKFLVKVSYMEIYNEEVYDLLAKDPRQPLHVIESIGFGVFVKGLTGYVLRREDDLEKILKLENHNRLGKRKTQTSESHAIFTIKIESSEGVVSSDDDTKVGVLQFVNLAFPKQPTNANDEPTECNRWKQGASLINLSVSVLANVIRALALHKDSHIPYRDSKLTRLLKDSLGGNCKTVMFAFITPADSDYKDVISTLRYACRVKIIQNQRNICIEPRNVLIRQLQEEIEALRCQLKQISMQKGYTAKPLDSEASLRHSEELNHAKLEQQRLRTKIKEFESQVVVDGKNILEDAVAQESLIEKSAAELRKQRKVDRKLKKNLEAVENEKIDMERRFLSLQEENVAKGKIVARLEHLIELTGQQLSDEKEQHARDRQTMTQNIANLRRDIGLSRLVVDSYIPKKCLSLIEANTSWNEELGDWQFRGIAHTGNNAKSPKVGTNEGKKEEESKEDDLSDVNISAANSLESFVGADHTKRDLRVDPSDQPLPKLIPAEEQIKNKSNIGIKLPSISNCLSS